MKKHISKFAYVAAVAGTIALSILSADAQTVTRDAAGNYFSGRFGIAPLQIQVEKRDSITGLSYTDAQGKVYSVYVGTKGAHYVCRVSKKTGKFYRQYLKAED